MTIALPDSGDGSRRRLREETARRKRRRATAEKIVVGVIVLVALVAGVVFVFGGGSSEQGADAVEPLPVAGPEAGKVGLLLVRDRGVASATLLVVDDDGRGGSIVHLPPSTLVEAPPLGLVTLRQAHEQGGLTLVQLAIENMIGRSLDAAADIDAAGITAAVTPAGPFKVALPEPVLGLPAGAATVRADQIAPLLAAAAPSELAQLVRHQAFWAGWLQAIKGSAAKAPPETSLGPTALLVRALAEDQIEHQGLPVESVGAAGESLYRLRSDELDGLLASVLPKVPAFTARPTAELLNGAGSPGLALRVAPKLVEAGTRVTKTGNADRFGVSDTQVVYFDPRHAEAASKVVAMLGVGQALPGQGAHVADLTVVVGTDFASAPSG
jgi:hypothetical protein